MNLPTITNITRRVFREDLTYVLYKIKLSDGRMLKLEVPFNGSLTNGRALDDSRPLAEEETFQILSREVATGRYYCCAGAMPKHAERCGAVV